MAAKVGIIAGGGDFPKRLVQACRESGRAYFVLGLEGHSDPAFVESEPHGWVRIGAWSPAMALLRGAGVGELVMAGPVRRPGLNEIRPDLAGAKVLARLARAWIGDDSLLKALADELELEGFRVIAPDSLLTEYLAATGPYGRLSPDGGAREDIDRGLGVLRAIGALDIGQAVVVQHGYVLGVEAAEGTDALIRRCAALQRAGRGAVLVKAHKPGQDRRIDLPAIGHETVEAAADAGFAGIAIEAGFAFVFDREASARLADDRGLFVVGV